MDGAIVEAAKERGGVYDPRAHERSLGARPVVIAGRAVAADAVIAANVRRVERLERHRLVERRDDGTWRVPANLVDGLREREKTHPRLRTVVEPLGPALAEQIRQRDRSWLDAQIKVDDGRSARGFGAEVTVAVGERDAFLRGFGEDAPGVPAPSSPRDLT